MIKKISWNQDKGENRRQTISKQEIIYAFIDVVSAPCSSALAERLNGFDMQRYAQFHFTIHDMCSVHACMMYGCMKRGRRMLLNANTSVIYNALIWHGVICAQSYDVWIWLYHTPFLLHMFIEMVPFCDSQSYFDILSSQCEQFASCLLEYSFVTGGNWESIA